MADHPLQREIDERDRLQVEADSYGSWTVPAIFGSLAFLAGVGFTVGGSDLGAIFGMGGLGAVGYALWQRKEMRLLRRRVRDIESRWGSAGYSLEAIYDRPGLQPRKRAS